MTNKYIVSIEVQKYPYCGRPDETEDYLSEKICCYTIKIRKKIVRRTKRLFVYGQLIFCLGNGLVPAQAVGLPILPTTTPIMRSIYSDIDLSKKAIIAQVIKDIPDKIVFTEREMDQLYDLSVKCRNNSISQEELITTLRGGAFVDVVGAIAIIAAMIIITLFNQLQGQLFHLTFNGYMGIKNLEIISDTVKVLGQEVSRLQE